ncbi:MAG: M14 family zinc carboxypeptidase [Flavobacterium sp.]|uniref:M14 family zinc carboxypeptidase n=1 Tax=Flavobacterium sp. TaxID=239 RepID=UPI003BD21064
MNKKFKYLFYTFLFVLPIYGQFNPQNDEITKKFFPDSVLDIHTPAFSKKGFTNYDDLMVYLNKLVAEHPNEISLSFIGESQKNKKIPMVILNKNNGNEKVKVWFQGGLHGDEPAGTETMLFLLDKLLNDPNYVYLLDKITLSIVPMANIDGYEKQDRYAANGLDLNRDQVKLMCKESNFLKKAFSNFGAEVAVDFHEYRPFRKEFNLLGTDGICSIYDAMFMYSGNLNLPQNLRDYTKNVFVGNAKKVLESNNFIFRDYIASVKQNNEVHFNQCTTEARSSTTSFALTNCISSLIEIRGVNLQKTSFKRRINTTFLIATSFLKTVYDDATVIKEVLKISNNANPENIVVVANKPQETQTIRAIDLKDNTEIALEVKVNNALKCIPVLERKRPFGYLILPEQKNLVDKLIILGLKVEELSEEKNIKVESYNITSIRINPEEEEGFNAQKVETTVSTIEKSFPKGTFIVYLNQKNAKIVNEVLEPESENGFIKFEVLKIKLNNELPIYRYLTNEKI